MSHPNPLDLLRWYDQHARRLPWRVSPQERADGIRADAYRVWLSEIMLQQTTVVTVKSYFEKFIKLWPTLEALSRANREEILSAWAGLGYYSRARNLKACADLVMAHHGGQFPDTVEALKKLPGIGDYTAAAIAAIAFERQAAVVDGNVERVLARIYAIGEVTPKLKRIVKTRQQALTPKYRPGDYAQAIMDLGATICTPKKPLCGSCVWREACLAYRGGLVEKYPTKPRKNIKPKRYGHAFVALREDGVVLLQKRPECGLLGGMSEVPGTVWLETPLIFCKEVAPIEGDWFFTGQKVKHTFTHFHLEIDVFKADFFADQASHAGGWWSSVGTLQKEALPSLMKKILKAALPRCLC